MVVILGPASERLGQSVAKLLGVEAVPVESRAFPDGESYIRLTRSIHDKETIIIQSTYPPQDRHLIQLFLIIDAARDHGAKSITAVVPYLAYARQDKRFREGDALSAKTIMSLIEASGATQFITFDIHQPNTLKHFHIPSTNLSAMPAIAEYFAEQDLKRPIVIAPDRGALDKAKIVAEELKADHDFLDKRRDMISGKVTTTEKKMGLQGRDVVIVDDIIVTGSSVANAASIASRQGAHCIFVACTHALLQEGALQKLLEAGVKSVVGTDCVESEFSQISVASLIADAVRR